MEFKDSELHKLLSDTTTKPAELRENVINYLLTAEAKESKVAQLKEKDGSNYFHLIASTWSPEAQEKFLAVIYLLASQGADIDSQDVMGDTPLHAFVSHDGHWKVINALQRLGASPYITNNAGKTAKDLIKDDKTKLHFHKFFPTLWDAVGKGDTNRVETLVKSWCFPHRGVAADGKEKSMLEVASETENIEKCDIFVKQTDTLDFIKATLSGDASEMKRILEEAKKPVNVNVSDESFKNSTAGFTKPLPLIVAAILDVQRKDVIEILLDKEAEVNKYIDGLSTRGPVFFAIEHGNTRPSEEAAEVVITQADLSLKNHRGETLLFLAAPVRSLQYIRKLLDQGIDLAERDCDGHTVYDKALFSELKPVIQTYNNYILNLVTAGDVIKLEKMVMDGFDRLLEVKNDAGKHVKTIAKDQGKGEVEDLLEKVPEILTKVDQIHQTIREGNLEKVQRLVDKKFALSRDKGGRYPIHTAVLYEQEEIVKHMYEVHPACVNKKDCLGRTPLHYAAALGHNDFYNKLCMYASGDESITDCHNLTPRDYQLEMHKPEPTDHEVAAAKDKETLIVRGLIAKEKETRYGIKIYLKLQLDIFIEKLKKKDLKGIKELIENLDASVDDFGIYHIATTPLVELCVDHKAEEIGAYILSKSNKPETMLAYGEDSEVFAAKLKESGLSTLYKAVAKAFHLDIVSLHSTLSTPDSLKSDRVQMPPMPKLKRKNMPVPKEQDARYLATQLGEALQNALADVAMKQPYDPIEYLGHWLYRYADESKYQEQQLAAQHELDIEKAEQQKEELKRRKCALEGVHFDEVHKEREKRKKLEEERKRRQKAEQERRHEEQNKRQKDGETHVQPKDMVTIKENQILKTS